MTASIGWELPAIFALSGEKSQAPTPQKRKQARGKGQGWHSPDFQSGLALLAGFVLLRIYLPWAGQQLGGVEAQILTMSSTPGPFAQNLGSVVVVCAHVIVAVLIPLVLPIAAVGIGVGLLQSGFRFSLVPLAPDFTRLNPLTGLQRMFSRDGLWLLVKGLLKMAIIGVSAGLAIWHQMLTYPNLINQPLGVAIHQGFLLLTAVLWRAALAYVLIGVADLAYQYMAFQRSLRMTTQEVRDEFKETEGDPRLKGKRRDIARKLARTGLRQVKNSQVVITNPTHYAVALKWDDKVMAAPAVAAKGVDDTALAIRELAYQHGVPVIDNPPLARSLYLVPLGQTIPEEHYQAVAEILAFLIRRKGRTP